MCNDNDEEERAMQWAERWISQRAEREKKRSEHDYDGVLGMLPDWFPKADRIEFQRIRNNLLEQRQPAPSKEKPTHYLEPQTVKAWIDAYMGTRDGPSPDDRFMQEVSTLARWYSAFLKGPEKGRAFLYGEEQAKTLIDGEQTAKARATAGQIRATQKREQGEQTRQKIAQAEARLRKRGICRDFNKLIARELGLSPDHVRKARKKRS